MADGTVTGEFRLTSVQARRELGQLGREAAKADVAMERLGSDLDKVGSTKQQAQIRKLRQEVKDLQSAARGSQGEIRKLSNEVERLGSAAQAAVTGGGRGGRGGRGGGGGLGAAGGMTLGGLVGMNQSMAMLAAKAAIALPAIRALSGGIAALGVTVASAAGGAGAVGAAGIGGMLTGIGGIAAVAIPASKAIKEAAEAQKKYNDAVRDYGRASREAGEARDMMRGAYGAAPRGTRSLIAEANAFGAAWKRATRSGQEALVGFMREVISVGSKIKKPLADISNMVTRAFARQGGRAARFLGSERMLRVARAGAGIFTENLGNVRRVGQAAIEMFGNVIRASRPFVKEFTNFLAKWFGRGQRRTRDIKEMRTHIGKMVDDLKSVAKLGGAGIRLILAVLGAGGARREGRNLLESATKQLDKWTKWLEKNPAKVKGFFRDAREGTQKLAGALVTVVGALNDMAIRLTPLLSGFTTLVDLAGKLGPIGTLLSVGTIRGAYKGSRKPAGGGAGTGGGGGGLAVLPGGGGGRAPRVRAPRVAPVQRGGAATMLGALRTGAGAAPRTPRARPVARARAAFGGSRVAGALRGGGKAFWPLAAGMAALDFMGTEGSVFRRTQGALAGLDPTGIIHTPKGTSTSDIEDRVAKTFGPERTITQQRAGIHAGKVRERELTGLLRNGRPGETIGWTGGGVGAGQPIQGPRTRISGPQRKAMEEEVRLLREENAARKGVVTQLDTEAGLRSQSHAGAAFTEDVKALQINARKHGREKGVRQFTSDTMRSIGRRNAPGRAGKEGRREAGNLALGYLDQLREKYPKLSDEYDEAASKIERRLRKMGDHVVVVNGRIYSSTQSAWKNIASSIGGSAARAEAAASKSFTNLQRQASQSLVDMGYSRKDANQIIRNTETITRLNPNVSQETALGAAGGVTAAGQRGAAQAKAYGKNARGGRIRGRGLMDTVPLVDGSMAAPGELIVNRHTEAEHDADARAMGLPTLAQRINTQRRPHSAPRRRTPKTDAYALGGRTGGTEHLGVNLAGANAGLAPYAALGATYGLHVTSGARPGSITNSGNVSLHSSGNAIDVSGSASAMLSYAKAMATQYGTGLDELIHTPMGFGIKNGQRVPPYAEADHHDHVHVGDRTPGGAYGPIGSGPGMASTGGISIPLLTAPKSGLGGIPGAMADRAMEIYTAGLNQRLQSIGGGAGAGAGGPVSGDLDGWLTQALQITGQYSPSNLAALRGRAMQESGGDPRAQNNWDSNAKKGIPSKGLLQTIDPTFQAHALTGMQDIWNPVHNAVAAIRYMLSRYGHIVAANGQGYEGGGRMGDFFRQAMGGKPSLFAGKSTGGEIKVSVNIANVNVGADGNAGAVGAQIGEQVAARLASALRKASVL